MHLDHCACSDCGFELWLPLAALSVCDVGMYDDARFPGRMIVSLREHVEHLDEVRPDLLSCLMQDVTAASTVLRKALGADRVNVAFLGNQVPHLHAHLIPRYGASEPMPTKAPWSDSRPSTTLGTQVRRELLRQLTTAFVDLASAASY
jgi:diadenosine tetraphosphate (Ap4A) HIT family hydrolase